MARFRYSRLHSQDNPPPGIVKGILRLAEPGQYIVQFRLVNSTTLFAGPTEVTVEDGSNKAPVSSDIIQCNEAELRVVHLVVQYKKINETEYREGLPRDVNYKCFD